MILQEPEDEGPNPFDVIFEKFESFERLRDGFSSLISRLSYLKYGLIVVTVLCCFSLISPILKAIHFVLQLFQISFEWMEIVLNYFHGNHLSKNYTDGRIRKTDDSVTIVRTTVEVLESDVKVLKGQNIELKIENTQLQTQVKKQETEIKDLRETFEKKMSFILAILEEKDAIFRVLLKTRHPHKSWLLLTKTEIFSAPRRQHQRRHLSFLPSSPSGRRLPAIPGRPP